MQMVVNVFEKHEFNDSLSETLLSLTPKMCRISDLIVYVRLVIIKLITKVLPIKTYWRRLMVE